MENKLTKNRRNKTVTTIIIVFICIIVLCTYFSKTVKNMLLSEVTVIHLKPGAIGDGFEGSGVVKYEDTHKIYSMSNWDIKEIEVKANQNVKKGDVLAKVDNDEINLKEKEEKEVIMQLEDEINSLKKVPTPDQDRIKEDQFKLDTENIKYKAIRKGLTEDGSILSDMDGKIVTINSQNGASNSAENASGSSNASQGDESVSSGVSEGNVLFEIVSNTPSLSVNWTVSDKDGDKFSIGDKINVTTGDGDDSTKSTVVTATISSKKYNSQKDDYQLLGTINDKSDLKQDDKITISRASGTKRYNNVIPKSCLYDENGTDYIYEVSSRNGALGEEDYVQKIQVQVGVSDSLNCSIKSSSDLSKGTYGIVSNTSKPIDDNDEVKLIVSAATR